MGLCVVVIAWKQTAYSGITIQAPDCMYTRIETRQRFSYVFRGCVDVSSDARYLVAYNCHNGFDLHDLTTRKRLRTYQTAVGENAPLSVVFVHSDADVLVRSTIGEAQIVDLSFDVMRRLRHKSMCQSCPCSFQHLTDLIQLLTASRQW